MRPIIIALGKGRILKESLPLLSSIDIHPTDDLQTTRKLIINSNHEHIKLLVLRSSDLPVYLNRGIATIGIVGKDVLLEQTTQNYYEHCDLKISPCQLVLASKPEFDWQNQKVLKIATKFTNTARQWFAQQGKTVDIIKLNGAMELAATSGLADAIIDLVASGETLLANGLQPFEKIADISGRLIVNQVAFKYRDPALEDLLQKISQHVNAQT